MLRRIPDQKQLFDGIADSSVFRNDENASTLSTREETREVHGHRVVIVSNKESPGFGRSQKYLGIGKAREPAFYCGLHIDFGFASFQTSNDPAIQISVRLKPDSHDGLVESGRSYRRSGSRK